MTCRNYIPGPNGDCQRCGEMRAGHAGSEHPWQAFLTARRAAIKWMHDDGATDEEIAKRLSMDPVQVKLIRMP